MSETSIRMTGLKEFVDANRKMAAAMPGVVQRAMNLAAEAVMDEARPHVPRGSGRAAASIRGHSTRNQVRILAGGPAAPYYPWLDFGGRVGRKKSVKRAFSPDGRYLYPAYFRLSDQGAITDIMSKALIDAGHSAGLVITDG